MFYSLLIYCFIPFYSNVLFPYNLLFYSLLFFCSTPFYSTVLLPSILLFYSHLFYCYIPFYSTVLLFSILLSYSPYIRIYCRLPADGEWGRINQRWIMRNYPGVSDTTMIRISFIKLWGKGKWYPLMVITFKASSNLKVPLLDFEFKRSTLNLLYTKARL